MSLDVRTSTQGTGLGVKNLVNVANFTQAATSLGLLEKDTNKLTTFLGSTVAAGGLSPAKLTLEEATRCTTRAVESSLLPVTAAPHNVAILLNNAKDLGITPMNIKSQVDRVMAVAEKNNLISTLPSDQTGLAASVGQAIIGHKLKFVPYDFTDILTVKMTQGINEHPRLYIKGILKPQDSNEDKTDDQTIQEAVAGTAAALYSVDEMGAIEPLFQGQILKITQTQSTDLTYLEIQVVNASYNLDVMKSSRSFQRKSATYKEIIDALLPTDVQVKLVPTDKAVEKLIVQYKETNWQFMKRLASHFNTGLVPVATTEKAQIYFGVETGQEAKEITVAAYTIQKNLGKYRTTEANHITHSKPNISDIDFISYKIESFDRYHIGDAVKFLKHTLYIKSLEGVLEQGTLKYSYLLVSKNGLVQPDIFNEHLIGVSIMGQVKVITKDQIKAHIVEIDKEWDEGTDWYFPYSTVFSSPDGSGWYAMPEPGDTVRIHFPTHKEEDAVAASSVNRDQASSSQQQTEGTTLPDAPRSDPDKKSLSNKYGKEVLFTPEGIYITNQAGKIFINLTDADGITIVSEKNITVTSQENIVIQADKELFFIAGEKLTLTNGDSIINMNKANVIEIQGSEVKTN